MALKLPMDQHNKGIYHTGRKLAQFLNYCTTNPTKPLNIGAEKKYYTPPRTLHISHKPRDTYELADTSQSTPRYPYIEKNQFPPQMVLPTSSAV